MKQDVKLSNSMGVRLENLYKKIDKRVEDHYKNSRKKPPCKKGCSNCCSQFFEISDFEFMFILEGLSKLDKTELEKILNRVESTWNEFEKLYPDFAKQYFISMELKDVKEAFNYYNNPLRQVINLPCVFLDPKSNGCLIYEYRPLVCHTHGVSYVRTDGKGKVCNKIRFSGLARRWQSNLTDLLEEIISFEILKSEKHKNNEFYQDILFRTYPILYNMYSSFIIEKNGFNQKARFMYYEMPESVYLDTYHGLIIKKKQELIK